MADIFLYQMYNCYFHCLLTIKNTENGNIH